MSDLYTSVTSAIASFVFAWTGQRLDARKWRLGKDAPLSNGTYVRNGAKESAKLLVPYVSSLIWSDKNIPLLAGISEKNGWLLFSFTNAFYERACELLWEAKGESKEKEETYLGSRLRILARHGRAPCPPDPQVQRALWLAIHCAHRGSWPPEAEQAILAMSHHKLGSERVVLERQLGGVAEAILKLRIFN